MKYVEKTCDEMNLSIMKSKSSIHDAIPRKNDGKYRDGTKKIAHRNIGKFELNPIRLSNRNEESLFRLNAELDEAWGGLYSQQKYTSNGRDTNLHEFTQQRCRLQAGRLQ